jgi:hypothetical protein
MPNTIAFYNMGLREEQFVAGATLELRTSGHSPARRITIAVIKSHNSVVCFSAIFLSTPCEGTYDPETGALVLTNEVPADKWLRLLQGVGAEVFVDDEHPWAV